MNKGIFLVLLAAFGYGIMPLLVKQAYSFGAGLYEILTLRFALALVINFLLLIFKKKISSLNMGHINIIYCIITGILFALVSVTLFTSFAHLAPSIAEALFYSYPAVVLILSAIFFKEKVTVLNIFCIIIILLGVFCLADFKSGKLSLYGIISALLSCIMYSVYLLFLKTKRISAIDKLPLTFYMTLTLLVFSFVAGVIGNNLVFNFRPQAYLYIALISIFSTVVALYALNSSSNYLKASQIAVLSTVEPIITLFCDIVFLQFSPSLKIILGFIFIISGIIAVNAFTHKVKYNDIQG